MDGNFSWAFPIQEVDDMEDQQQLQYELDTANGKLQIVSDDLTDLMKLAGDLYTTPLNKLEGAIDKLIREINRTRNTI